MSEPWRRVGDLFDEARGVPTGQREEWVRSRCADPHVVAEVLSLLQTYEEAPAFLEQPVPPDLAAALDAAATLEIEGRRLGAYRLVREIGRGGMGVVYEAERTDGEFSRRVAIKLVPAGWSTSSLVARFREERRLLARLDHPGIARLMDAGTTEEGVPYLVMEYVDGTPIDEWCRERAVTVRPVIALVLEVLDAVEYAHRNLIVHRDLKAANILVTAEGAPKLLDFGVAKLLSEEAASAGGLTVTGRAAFTPAYASPEQVRGEVATTACDVYSLGVLLYLLLTKRPPCDVAGLSHFEAMRAVCEAEPPVPSTVAPPEWRRQLQGDLDNVLLLALRKEARERYRSVHAMASDLRAWLDGRPVSASPATLWYRTARFLKRHTAATIAAGMVLTTLSVAVVLTFRSAAVARAERALAERRFDDLRQLARSNIFELHDAIQAVPGSAPARNLLIQRALQYLDRLNAEPGANAQLREDLAVGYERVGQLAGNFSGPGIGDSQAALASFRKALSLRESLAAGDSGNPDTLHALCELLCTYSATLQQTGQLAEAMRAARQALRVGGQAVLLRRGDAGPKLDVARAHFTTAFVAGGNGSSGSTRELSAAIQHDRQALELLESLPAEDARTRRSVAIARLALGFHLQRARAFGEAAAVFDVVLSSERTHPALSSAQRQILHNWRGLTFERAGDQRRALGEYDVALRLAREIVEADPHSIVARLDLAIAEGHLGTQSARLGRLRDGLGRLKRAVATVERLIADDPSSSLYSNLLVIAYTYEAEILSSAGDQAGAEAKVRAAMKTANAVPGPDPEDLEPPLTLAKLHAFLGVVLGRAARYAEATAELGEARERIAGLLRLRPGDAEAQYTSQLVRDNLAALDGCAGGRPCSGTRRLRLPTLLN